jgi:predicted  nucleic acid-binding Zn-ribbon protein
MSENEVGNQLEAVKQQMGELMDRLHTAEARRDQFRNQMSSDANKASAYEGAEAEVEALEGKRGALMHRQHRLEARAREIQGTK